MKDRILCSYYLLFSFQTAVSEPSPCTLLFIYVRLGHMTCIGQWNVTRGGVCYFVAETLRTVTVSSTELFFMSDSNTSLLGIWNPEGGNVEKRHGQPTVEIYQE